MKNGAIVRNTLTSQVTEQLRKDILLGEFPSGVRITAQSVAERYNTSQLPVREAMQTLSGEYLLTLNPYKGATVAVIDRGFVDHMYDILRSMEVLLIESITEHWTPELRAEVVEINDHIASLSLEELRANYNTLNRKFHGKIEQFCNNPQALDLRNLYHRNVTILSDQGLPHTRERYEAAIEEHKHIIAAIDTGDVNEIRKEYHVHAIAAQKELHRQIENLPIFSTR